MSETHQNLALRQVIVAGAAAGNITVTGIKTRDVLKSVIGFTLALTEGEPNTLAFTPLDLTDEFTITAADTINNAAGTTSEDGLLIVTYIAASDLGGDLNRN